MFRAGGDAWIPGSYDPKTNLIFWGTSQAKPWTRFARGTDGDALYTNCTLALDPATGKIVWYYQHIPGETHDMDETFERILVDAGPIVGVLDGQARHPVGARSQDRQFLSARDLGYQNLLDVDPQTGKATYRPDKIPAQVSSSNSVRARPGSRACAPWPITPRRRRSTSRSISTARKGPSTTSSASRAAAAPVACAAPT